jgi:hypothetical protein
MTATEPFDQRLRRFYDECNDEERAVLAFMATTAQAVNDVFAGTDVEGFTQARSDLGQQLQLQLQEANNIYTRSTKAQSDMSSKWSQTLDSIAQNLK